MAATKGQRQFLRHRANESKKIKLVKLHLLVKCFTEILTRLLTMIKKCCFIITVPIKVYFMRFFMGVKGDDILWKPETVFTEVVGERERVIFSPVKCHLINCVLIWNGRNDETLTTDCICRKLQLEKSTGQDWTSNGYKTKSMSHLMIIVAPMLKLIVLFS